jgi:hypothetical protein
MKSLLAQYCKLQGGYSSIACSSAFVDGNTSLGSRILEVIPRPVRISEPDCNKY